MSLVPDLVTIVAETEPSYSAFWLLESDLELADGVDRRQGRQAVAVRVAPPPLPMSLYVVPSTLNWIPPQ